MSLLYNCQALSKSYGARTLFKDLHLSIFSGDQIGLIGPNGSGKSTLLKLLTGEEKPNTGILSPRRGLKIGYVPQTCEFPNRKPLAILVDALSDSDVPDYDKLRHAEMWLSKMGFVETALDASALSGGWKKRLALARELIRSPELLLLDEPTNHLDLEGILWLEKFLKREAPTYLLISHDRYFLQNTTNRIVEIDRIYPKGLFAIDGDYSHFLAQKEQFLAGQLQQERSLSSKLRKEKEWLSKSAKARTTKSQSRIDEAHELIGEVSQIQERNKQRIAHIAFAATERETRKLLTAKNIAKSAGGRLLFQKLDFTLSPSMRIGLMGPNGSGKTTLLRLLAGELEPDQGTIKRADELKVVYFDQHRKQLPNDITLRQALSPKGDYVEFHGTPIHVNGWCKRFLFSPDLLDLKIGYLSGGERARISIAHLMLQPADLLLLDEPTNDLDIPTLETLEESLIEFPGAVVLITHDRCMLDRICNTLLALGNPAETAFFADYAQWQESLQKLPEPPKKEKAASSSYTQKKEREQIERKIEKLEEEVRQLNKRLEQDATAQDSAALTQICRQINLAETQIEQLYLRWAELG